MIDIIIVGGGPAGLSAGISARQRNNSVVVISDEISKNRLYKASRVDNYPGFPGISGAELLEKMSSHALDAGAQMVVGKVTNILPGDNSFHVAHGNEISVSKSIIIATGVSHSSLFPGEERLLGRGLSYCATCDGMLYRGKRVCVICLTDEAEEEADYLESIGCEVIRSKSQNVSINGENKVSSVTIDGETIDCDGLFIIRQGIAPHLLLPGLEVVGGYINASPSGHTSLPGVFAAGDCVGTPHQISKAVGQGLVAALSASVYIRAL